MVQRIVRDEIDDEVMQNASTQLNRFRERSSVLLIQYNRLYAGFQRLQKLFGMNDAYISKLKEVEKQFQNFTSQVEQTRIAYANLHKIYSRVMEQSTQADKQAELEINRKDIVDLTSRLEDELFILHKVINPFSPISDDDELTEVLKTALSDYDTEYKSRDIEVRKADKARATAVYKAKEASIIAANKEKKSHAVAVSWEMHSDIAKEIKRVEKSRDNYLDADKQRTENKLLFLRILQQMVENHIKEMESNHKYDQSIYQIINDAKEAKVLVFKDETISNRKTSNGKFRVDSKDKYVSFKDAAERRENHSRFWLNWSIFKPFKSKQSSTEIFVESLMRKARTI